MFGIYTQYGLSSKYSYNKNCTNLKYFINLISNRANIASFVVLPLWQWNQTLELLYTVRGEFWGWVPVDCPHQRAHRDSTSRTAHSPVPTCHSCDYSWLWSRTKTGTGEIDHFQWKFSLPITSFKSAHPCFFFIVIQTTLS